MSQYIFESNREDKELHRLRMIEAARDSSTIQLLERTGINHGWRCLELGPGGGSMLKWIGEKVGTAGLVVGVEKKPVYLQAFSSPLYDIREGDFLRIGLDGAFDLVYGRYFLIHNRNNLEYLRKIHGLLNTNGYAVFEEPDFTSAKLLNDHSNTSHHRVNSAICKMFVDYGLDPGYGLHLPQNLHYAGFQIVEAHTTIHLCEGNSPIANLMAESALVLSEEYQKTGKANADDILRYVANAHNREYWSVYYSTTSIIARQKRYIG
jgi:SAM-dependent methyltransferase